ncbi:MAG: MaoC family dehydratase [Thermoleophilia bacterium]
MDTPLYLDDLAPGQRWETGSHTLTEEEVVAFAADYDPQPFHLDDAAATGTLFGRLAASGWHTAGITMRLQVRGGPPIAGGLIGAGGEIAWPRPTYPGDTLRATCEIVDVRPSRSRPDRGIVRMLTTTLNQDDEVVQTLTAALVVPRRPA